MNPLRGVSTPTDLPSTRGRGEGEVRRCGFTLIELMVVLGLMAILAAVILPEMRGTYGHEVLRATGRDLLLSLNLAYSQAVTERQPHRFLVDSKENRYRIERPALDTEGGLSFEPLRDVAGAEGKFDRGITAEVREKRRTPEEEEASVEVRPRLQGGVEFYPDGTAEAKEIVLRDREGYEIILRVNAITARASLVEAARP